MTAGIKPTENVLLIERRLEQQIVYNALVLGLTMLPQLAGTNGEPALEVVFINQFAARHAGTSDWHHALTRAGDVVHSSHKDWREGRVALCYEEIPSAATVPSDVLMFTPTEYTDIAARVAHEANRILCCVLGDYSQPTWEAAPPWQQDSAIAGTTHIQANPATTPAESHASWMAQKIADGWVYGPVKDPVAKTHYCLVPYDQLPPAQQFKDWMFGATVRGVLNLPQTATAPQAPPAGAEGNSQAAGNPAAENQASTAPEPVPEPVAVG